jgi:hypothetical protein
MSRGWHHGRRSGLGLSAADFPLQAGPPQRPKSEPAKLEVEAVKWGTTPDAHSGPVRLVPTDRKKAGAK